jgi:hypothetical protein
MRWNISCWVCSGNIGLDLHELGAHVACEAPAPAEGSRRDYWRQRNRQTKELAKRDASLFGLSPSRVGHVLGVYGKRTSWERIVREDE